MAKTTRALDMRGVKDWFSGLSFEVQEKVLGDLGSAFETSKEERINALEQEISALRGGRLSGASTRRVTAKRTGAVKANVDAPRARRASPKKGVKVPPKYADGKGNTWAGRGVHPRWVRDYLKKRGNKVEDLLIKK